jgi:hypothetical protein
MSLDKQYYEDQAELIVSKYTNRQLENYIETLETMSNIVSDLKKIPLRFKTDEQKQQAFDLICDLIENTKL